MTNWNKEVLKAIDSTTAIIRKNGSKSRPYCVYSENTGRNFGCYSTRKQAEERLAQIEMFRNIK